MDSAYLKKHFETCLSDCLAVICMTRPFDPIEYMGLWLYKFAENKIRREREDTELKLTKQAKEERDDEIRLSRLLEEEARLQVVMEQREAAEIQAAMAAELEQESASPAVATEAPSFALEGTPIEVDDHVYQDDAHRLLSDSEYQSADFTTDDESDHYSEI